MFKFKFMDKAREEQLFLAELQVLLAELRTHLSLVRTGAGMVVSSVTIIFLLVVNQIYLPTLFVSYGIIIHLILSSFALTGGYLLIRSERKILKLSRLIKEIEHKNERVDRLMV